MSTYSKHFARVIDLTMRNRDSTRLRPEWIPQARGEALKIGIGSGPNLPFYSSAVTHLQRRSFFRTPADRSQTRACQSETG